MNNKPSNDSLATLLAGVLGGNVRGSFSTEWKSTEFDVLKQKGWDEDSFCMLQTTATIVNTLVSLFRNPILEHMIEGHEWLAGARLELALIGAITSIVRGNLAAREALEDEKGIAIERENLKNALTAKAKCEERLARIEAKEASLREGAPT